MPIWLLPKDDSDRHTDDGSFPEKELLCRAFLEEIRRSRDGQEWLDAYEMGRDFRRLMYPLDCTAIAWRQKSWARWVQDRFEWAQLHPGVACPDTNEYNFQIEC